MIPCDSGVNYINNMKFSSAVTYYTSLHTLMQ